MTNSAQPIPTNISRFWVTEEVQSLFAAEIANERHGGVSPATLSSTIDSIAQGLPFEEGTDVTSVLTALLVLRDMLPGDTEVADLL